jgi:hypothetical protein
MEGWPQGCHTALINPRCSFAHNVTSERDPTGAGLLELHVRPMASCTGRGYPLSCVVPSEGAEHDVRDVVVLVSNPVYLHNSDRSDEISRSPEASEVCMGACSAVLGSRKAAREWTFRRSDPTAGQGGQKPQVCATICFWHAFSRVAIASDLRYPQERSTSVVLGRKTSRRRE